MKTLKKNISEAYKVQVDCLKDSESKSCDKKDMKEKVNAWLGCTRQCNKNWKQDHIQNKSKYLKSQVVKEYINKNFATCQSLYNLQELYTAFKEKDPNVNIGFSKFCALRPK